MYRKQSRSHSMPMRSEELSDKSPKRTDDPVTLIRLKFRGQDVSLFEVMNYLNSIRNVELGDRQTRRYLDKVFRKARPGIWRIT